MTNYLVKKNTLLGIKIISTLCALFLTAVEVYNQIQTPTFLAISNINFYSLRRLIGNAFVICLFVILSLYPHKLEFLAIASFYYTLICFIDDFNNPIGICMFFLGISILYIRGFFINKRNRKIIITVIIYCLLLLSKLHFGYDNFLEILINHLGYTTVLSTILFLLIEYKQNIDSNPKSKNTRILDLSQYHELVENDIALLQKVLEDKQYKVIANEVFKAEGTVRNRLNKIYDILGVMDKMGFISTYMGYEIVFQNKKYKSDNEKPKSVSKKKK